MKAQPVFVYVEDDEMSREVLQLLLGDVLGYNQVNILSDSGQVIERLEKLECPPDLIFLDIHMHPYDGFSVLKMLREHEKFKGTTIVALTASVMLNEVRKLKAAGFDGVIAKPINPRIFSDLINRLLAGENVWHVN